MELQKGQKCKLADLTGSGQLRISVTVSLPGSEADVTCFGVDGAGKLSDDRYFIFYNQTSSPEGAVSMHQSGESTVFSVDLNRLPGFLQRLVVTVAAESGTMQALARGLLTLEGELDRAAYVFTGAGVSAGEGPDSLRGVPQGWDLALFRGGQRLQRGTLRPAGPLRRGGGQA